tara:strand:+ start:338 stop:607 length:270 start_codon:yes stop_codon:yes gene_type:complete
LLNGAASSHNRQTPLVLRLANSETYSFLSYIVETICLVPTPFFEYLARFSSSSSLNRLASFCFCICFLRIMGSGKGMPKQSAASLRGKI